MESAAGMSEIADHIAGGSVLLCDESFAATKTSYGEDSYRKIFGKSVSGGLAPLRSRRLLTAEPTHNAG
jgi:hypothetical protein